MNFNVFVCLSPIFTHRPCSLIGLSFNHLMALWIKRSPDGSWEMANVTLTQPSGQLKLWSVAWYCCRPTAIKHISRLAIIIYQTFKFVSVCSVRTADVCTCSVLGAHWGVSEERNEQRHRMCLLVARNENGASRMSVLILNGFAVMRARIMGSWNSLQSAPSF